MEKARISDQPAQTSKQLQLEISQLQAALKALSEKLKLS
jgi:hypothetical protein